MQLALETDNRRKRIVKSKRHGDGRDAGAPAARGVRALGMHARRPPLRLCPCTTLTTGEAVCISSRPKGQRPDSIAANQWQAPRFQVEEITDPSNWRRVRMVIGEAAEAYQAGRDGAVRCNSSPNAMQTLDARPQQDGHRRAGHRLSNIATLPRSD